MKKHCEIFQGYNMDRKFDTEEDQIANVIINYAYQIHKSIGPGLLESAYQAMMLHDLTKAGLDVLGEHPLQLFYDGVYLPAAYRIDLLVNDLVIVELKSVEAMKPVYKKQLLTYLRLNNKRLGLLINFGMPLFKDGVSRVVNGL